MSEVNANAEGAARDTSVTGQLLEAWDRQTQIMTSLVDRIGEEERSLKPSPDGWPIYEHLCHIHEVRYGWLSKVSKAHVASLGEVYVQDGDVWNPIEDLGEIKRQLALSARAVGDAVAELLEAGSQQVGPYTHPVQFLQHMIWHEGWHFGLIILALRLGGKELSEEWEEANVWGVWRTEE